MLQKLSMMMMNDATLKNHPLIFPGDAIILNCQAEGTPTPEILWYKDENPVEPSATIGIFNDGTELRISNIRHEDIGDYTCIARNGEGQVSHTARVIIAGGAVITVNHQAKPNPLKL